MIEGSSSMDEFQILDELTIDDPETIKVLGDPLRLQILEQTSQLNAGGELATAKKLAEALDAPQTKLYYHLNLLEEHGLIVVGETALVSGIMEKRYRVRARRLRAEIGVGQHDAEFETRAEDLVLGPLTSILARTRDVAEGSVRTVTEHPEMFPSSVDDQLHINQKMMHLTDSEAQEFAERLDALIEEYRQGAEEGRRSYHLTAVFIPVYSADAAEGAG
jgi:DNA-binding transcriptional ArsR family regulator